MSVDFGHTAPDSLTFLEHLPNSEVRIPDATAVIGKKLLPFTAFHPKSYLLHKTAGSAGTSGILLGSANLTAGALHTNTEQATLVTIKTPITPADRHAQQTVASFLDWWDKAWATAEPATPALIAAYKAARRVAPRFPDRDRASAALALPGSVVKVPAKQAVLWANSRAFWIDVRTLYKNLENLNAGNQLDCKRGTRVFFGFTPNDVPINHIFGDVTIQVPGYPPQTRSVRYGHNHMDKVNLPVPDGVAGPTSYDNKTLLFERTGPATFRLSLGSTAQRARWRVRSASKGLVYKVGRREFGFF